MLMHDDHSLFSRALFFALLLHVAAAVLLTPIISRSNINELPLVISVMMAKTEQPASSEAAQRPPEPLPQKSKPVRPLSHQASQQPSIMVVNDAISAVTAEAVPPPEPTPTQVQTDFPVSVAATDVPASNSSLMGATLPSTKGSLASPQLNADYLSNPAPEYPVESREKHEEGVVLLRVYVTADGNPEEITLYRSSHFTLLDHASEEAVWHWKFIPGRQDGKVAAAWVIVPVRFSLRK